MKRLAIIAVIALTIAGVLFFKAQLKTNLSLNARWAAVYGKIEDVRNGIVDIFKKGGKKLQAASRVISSISAKSDLTPETTKAVKLILKHGGIIEGALLEKGKDFYVVDWKGEKTRISASQVKSAEFKTKKDVDWPYKNNIVLKKTNGIIIDGKIAKADPEAVTMAFDEGGGELEMSIKRQEIDHLIFAPVYNKHASQTEASLRTQFPKMKVYKEGNITIFTDSYDTWAKQYQKTVRAQYTDIYLKFFKVFKDRKAQNQEFIVVFDDFGDYCEYALTDGVPGWLAVGYFEPVNKVLYVFNAFGTRMEKMVFDVIVGKTGKRVDQIVNVVKKHVDERYHIFIDGQVKELTDRYWDVYSLFRAELTELTMSVLRHEFTHEMFNGWGLQNIIVYKPNIDNAKLARKKKEILDTKDWKKKEELLMSLMNMRKPEDDIEIESAQSWLNEGLATYCETEPIGSIDKERLFTFQEMNRKTGINPIEFLTSFKIGSFRGLTHKAKLDAYAESWAFTTFLMNKYPDGFMDYQIAMAKDVAVQKDDLGILLKSLGKDLPSIEKEFVEYMRSYETVDDPDVASFMKYYNIWSDLLQSSQ